MRTIWMVIFLAMLSVRVYGVGSFVPVAVDTNSGTIKPESFTSFLPPNGVTNARPVYSSVNNAYVLSNEVVVVFNTNASGGSSGITNLAPVFSDTDFAYRSGNMGYVSFNTNTTGITNLETVFSAVNLAYRFGNMGYVSFSTNIGVTNLIYTNAAVGASRISGPNFYLGTNASSGGSSSTGALSIVYGTNYWSAVSTNQLSFTSAQATNWNLVISLTCTPSRVGSALRARSSYCLTPNDSNEHYWMSILTAQTNGGTEVCFNYNPPVAVSTNICGAFALVTGNATLQDEADYVAGSVTSVVVRCYSRKDTVSASVAYTVNYDAGIADWKRGFTRLFVEEITPAINATGSVSGGVGVTNLIYTNDIVGASRIAGSDFILGTNTAAGGSEGSSAMWATNAAVTNVNMNTFNIYNVSALTVTGRLVIGFGVYASSNDIPAPSSSNTWYVFAARTNNQNASIRLFGVNSDGLRVKVGP